MDKEQLEKELKLLDEKAEDAAKNAGDTEVRDAILEKATLLRKNNRAEESEKVYYQAIEKSVGVNRKLEIVFELLHLGIERKDLNLLKKEIEHCKKLLEQGGDWEKKNKLKVYEGVYLMMIRNFKRSAELLLDSVATFNSTELFEYSKFAFYAVLTCMVALDRGNLRKNVIHSPEILAVIRDLPALKKFSDSFYYCDYKSFNESFLDVIEQIKEDKFLSQHSKYFIKEMRVVAYKQFLESYKSVTIDNMARAFGVTPDFIDKELSLFIASGKLNCKIDKVAGVIESSRTHKRIDLYQNVVKQGDFLINRLQKLARVLEL